MDRNSKTSSLILVETRNCSEVVQSLPVQSVSLYITVISAASARCAIFSRRKAEQTRERPACYLVLFSL